MCHYGWSEQLCVSERGAGYGRSTQWFVNMSSTLLLSFFFPQTQVEFVCPAAAAGNSCNSSTSAGRKKKGPKGELWWLWQNPAGALTSGLLHTGGNINKRKWEKEVERGREWSFLASSSPLHLTLLLIVCSNKGGWQRWCCSIDRLVMGGDERAPAAGEWDS